MPGILLAPLLVVLMDCLHASAAASPPVSRRLSIAFALVYAVVILVDYFVQLTVVAPSLQAGETEGLSLFRQYNPRGLFIALESLGYSMMTVAFLFAAPVFAGGKVQRAIRALFTLGFVLAVAAFVALAVLGHDLVAFEVTVLMITWIVLIASGVLLSVVFRRVGRIPQ